MTGPYRTGYPHYLEDALEALVPGERVQRRLGVTAKALVLGARPLQRPATMAREHKGLGIYPEEHLWRASHGYLDLLAATRAAGST